jgi:hypothetical protein
LLNGPIYEDTRGLSVVRLIVNAAMSF